MYEKTIVSGLTGISPNTHATPKSGNSIAVALTMDLNNIQ